MCGIVGYIGEREAVPILLEGLKRLEYRGYDSAGIAIIQNNKLVVKRSVGKIKNLESELDTEVLKSNIGIGHTRWATHGRPSEENAHPHQSNEIVIVHNGIIENYLSLKDELKNKGYIFKSETDTEVIAHLISDNFTGDLEEAVREALKKLKGAYALGIISQSNPDKLIAACESSPLIIGLGEGEFFIASDIPAILNYTRDVIFLDDQEMAVLDRSGVRISNMQGVLVEKEVKKIMWDAVMAEKGGYKHFMLKEIFEQPRAIWDTIRGRISEDTGEVYLEEINISAEEMKEIEKITIVACGTSWHAALIGKFMLEELCSIPVEVDIGSEYRYRNPIISKGNLIITITQSGETADTLAALKEAKAKGAKTISICNVVGSSITRQSDGVIYTHAGPEIGVASTKAFTTQIVALYLFAIYLGRLKGIVSEDDAKEMIQDLVKIPGQVELILEKDAELAEMARTYFKKNDFLYLGRGINYPIALEGALKLKEISYIHAEGYPAGEMKHGPIALIDENMPVVVLATQNKVYEKILSNIEEVKARDGIIIAFKTEGDKKVSKMAAHTFPIPKTNHLLTPILLSIPMQLLAYHIAVRRGSDVDQPRNLAKSVTVE